MLPRSPSPDPPANVNDLSPEERQALIGAARWYANYHAHIIAENADDPSSYAVVQRERFDNLTHALRKLGARIPPPELRADRDDQAA